MSFDPGHAIPVDDAHPDNRGVLAYLQRPRNGPHPPLSAPPSAFADPYYELGTHPDVVEQLWDRLGTALPADSRCVVAGTPGLVDPASGFVLAVGLGTGYALRFAPADFHAALAEGATTTHHYRSVDLLLDISTWGPGWVYGSWAAPEAERLARAAAHARALKVAARGARDTAWDAPESPSPAPRG